MSTSICVQKLVANKLLDIVNLMNSTVLNTKTEKVGKKIPDHAKYYYSRI